MQGVIRRWFLHEDSWVITLGLGLVLAASLVFLVSPSGWLTSIHLTMPHWASWLSLASLLGDRLPSFAGAFALVLLMTLLSARGMGLSLGHWTKGFSCLWLIIGLCIVLGAYSPLKAWKLEGPLLALAIGFVLGNIVTLPDWIRVAMRGEFWLKLGIILMGATLPFTVIINAGPIAIGQSLLVACLGFGTCFLVATKVFGLDNKLAAALAGGLAVGNITGVIACSEASRAKLSAISTGFVLVVLSSVVLMFVLTGLSDILGLDGRLAGAWIGSAETADVAGFAALSSMNDDLALQSYTLVKVIGRDMGVVIWAFLVAILAVKQWDRSPERGESFTLLSFLKEIWVRFPKFILGLFGASLMTALILHLLPTESSLAYKQEVLGVLKDLRGYFFTLCFLSIGMTTRWAAIKAIGWRPVAAFSLSILVICLVGYVLSVYTFSDFWMTL